MPDRSRTKTRHYTQSSPGRNDAFCSNGEIVAVKIGYRAGLRDLAQNLLKGMELANTLDAESVRAVLEPLAISNDEPVALPGGFPTVPDYVYARAAHTVRDEFKDG